MYKFLYFFVACSILLLTGCIAGGGEPYDDSESVYEPAITVNKTIVDNAQYTLIINDIIRKSHEDVGNMVEITFQYSNKTDNTVFLTSEKNIFDGVEASHSVMAFFEPLAPHSEGTATAYFQDIQEQGWTLPPLTSSLYMDLSLTEEEALERVAQYKLDITF